MERTEIVTPAEALADHLLKLGELQAYLEENYGDRMVALADFFGLDPNLVGEIEEDDLFIFVHQARDEYEILFEHGRRPLGTTTLDSIPAGAQVRGLSAFTTYIDLAEAVQRFVVVSTDIDQYARQLAEDLVFGYGEQDLAFGEQLNQALEILAVSVMHVADGVSVTSSAVTQWRKGQTCPNDSHKAALVDYLTNQLL